CFAKRDSSTWSSKGPGSAARAVRLGRQPTPAGRPRGCRSSKGRRAGAATPTSRRRRRRRGGERGRAVLVGRFADDLFIARRFLRFGDELGGEQREPPEAVFAPPEGVARAARGLDGGAVAVVHDRADARQVAAQASDESSLFGERGEHVGAVGRGGR